MTYTEEDEQARRELDALLKIPGALRIITNEHDCGVTLMPYQAPADLNRYSNEFRSSASERQQRDAETCDAFEFPTTDPRHFVIHNATSIEELEHLGQIRAHTDEGDWTQGKPAAVLKRLREWRR